MENKPIKPLIDMYSNIEAAREMTTGRAGVFLVKNMGVTVSSQGSIGAIWKQSMKNG